MYIEPSGNSPFSATVTTLETNRWYNYACTYDGSNIRVYLDGILQGTSGAVTAAASNTEDLIIGDFRTGGGSEWDGQMADAIIWKRALPEKEIMSNYIYSYRMFEQPPGRILAAAVAAAVRRRWIIIH